MRNIISALFLLGFFLVTAPAPALCADMTVKGDSALVMDADTWEVLWEKNSTDLRAPASLIKVLNILTGYPYITQGEQVTIGTAVDNLYNGQMVDLHSGDVLTAENLLYSMMLWSANDSAIAFGQHLSNDLSLYAEMMDEKAWAIGAVHTTSININGYSDEKQKTTAQDLAIIAAEFIRNTDLYHIAQTKEYTITWLHPKEKTYSIYNINKLLSTYEGATGLKTGTTIMAGKCLIATAEKKGRTLIAVTLNSSNRYGDCAALLDYGFKK